MAPKPTSPLLGYNNNVRHKGRVFHVQTEDSGVKYGHIMTQLFMDGGRILKSVKTSYAEYVSSDRRGEIVREMMKQQHKAMFIALRDGHFDALVDGAASQAPPAPPTTSASKPSLPESPTISAVRPAADAAIKEAAAIEPNDGVRPESIELLQGPRLARTHAPTQVFGQTPAKSVGEPLAHRVPLGPPQPTAAPTMKMASAVQPSRPQGPVQAPPGRRMGSAVRDSQTILPADSRYAVASPEPANRETAASPVGRRTRATATAGQARSGRKRSAFDDDLTNDKSLDEVILSYLAAELENEKPK